jgi:hypothetical protein
MTVSIAKGLGGVRPKKNQRFRKRGLRQIRRISQNGNGAPRLHSALGTGEHGGLRLELVASAPHLVRIGDRKSVASPALNRSGPSD